MKKHRPPQIGSPQWLHQQYGTPAEQKDRLVDHIMQTFDDPGSWPLSDDQRIACIRHWHQLATRIRSTPP